MPPSEAMLTVFSERRSDLLITARETRAEGVVALTLADPAGAQLPAWTPGAHIDLLLDDTVRQYSLCGTPGDQHTWRIAVLLDPNGRGGSRRVHDTLQAGDRITVRGPRNHFPLHSVPRYIFLAGGIGITPILPMVAAATEAGADWKLYYGGRSQASMAFLDELEPYGDRVTVWPQDTKGLLPLDEILQQPGRRHPGLLLRPRGPADRGRAALRGLAPRLPAPGAVRRQAPARTRSRPGTRSSRSRSSASVPG